MDCKSQTCWSWIDARGGLGFDETDGKGLYHYKLPTCRDEVVEYFVSWVHTQFPDSLVLWVCGFCELASSTFTTEITRLETCMGIQRSLVDAIEKFRQLGRAVGADVLVNKSRIAGWGSHDGREAAIPGLRYVRPAAMRCGHGCRGPALRVLSKIIKLVIDKHESGLHTLTEAMKKGGRRPRGTCGPLGLTRANGRHLRLVGVQNHSELETCRRGIRQRVTRGASIQSIMIYPTS
jgi:hypothetical protein